MILKICVCDRCGADIVDGKAKITSQAPKSIETIHTDLCADCYNEFERFMRREHESK